jgi:DNA-binding winged helix-turn-helix (wHTH) protein/Tol biopolymer transport system component
LPPSAQYIRFGTFELDLRATELRKHGVKIKLQDQPFQVLVMLLERPGEVVTREQLQHQLWPGGTFTDFDHGLNTAIQRLRQALGDSAENPRFIETLARRGYRFLVPVTESGNGSSQPPPQLPQQVQQIAGKTDGILDRPAQGSLVPAQRWTGRVLPWVLFAVSVITLAVMTAVHFRPGHVETAVLRFPILLPGKMTFGPPHELGSPELSPDGRHIALTGIGSDGKSHLWLRSLDSLEFRLLPASGDWLGVPFWSPDSRFVAFFSLVNGHMQLKKLEIATGRSGTVYSSPEDNFGGGSWSRDGVILFSMADSFAWKGLRLYRVSATGGEVRPALPLDKSRHEQGQWAPQFLPDGQHFLYHSSSDAAGTAKGAVYLASIGSKEVTLVAPVDSCVRYAPPGFLIYRQEDTLFAQTLDLKRFRLTGEPFPVAGHIGHASDRPFCNFSTGERVLAYASTPSSDMQLAWYSRDGKRLGSIGKPGRFDEVRISPDETRVAVQQPDPHTGKPGIRAMELSTGILTAVTSNQAASRDPVWSPSGRELVFTSDQGGQHCLYKKIVGSENEELLFPSNDQRDFAAMQWLPDRSILLRSVWDFSRLPLTGKRELELLLKTEHATTLPQVSPDGHSVAYQSDESVRSGLFEVYLAAFPSFGEKRQVSNASGCQPLWRKDGRELFYLSLDGNLMSVDVGCTAGLKTSVPKVLFRAPGPVQWRFNQYCVTGDGKRFIFGEPVEEPGKPFTIVLNWTAGLKR